MAVTEIDYMETLVDDAAAQAAYVSSDAGSTVEQQQTTNTSWIGIIGKSGGVQYQSGQSFKLSIPATITAVEIFNGVKAGSPTGNWTLRIETDNAGYPSGTLADANASIVVTPPADSTLIKGTFATPFNLAVNTTYWIVAYGDTQTTGNYWQIMGVGSNVYANGEYVEKTDATWTRAGSGIDLYFKVYVRAIQSFSESTIKTQGSYALKAVAVITDSLNKTLTRTII